jgi:hypothetical protein
MNRVSIVSTVCVTSRSVVQLPTTYSMCVPINYCVGVELMARVLKHGMSALGCCVFGWVASLLAKAGKFQRSFAFADLCELVSAAVARARRMIRRCSKRVSAFANRRRRR